MWAGEMVDWDEGLVDLGLWSGGSGRESRNFGLEEWWIRLEEWCTWAIGVVDKAGKMVDLGWQTGGFGLEERFDGARGVVDLGVVNWA